MSKIFLDDLSQLCSSRPALFDEQAQRWISYEELDRLICQGCRRLEGIGRRLVMIFCRNDVATIVAYLAAVRAGHVVALLDGATEPAMAARLFELYQPYLVVAPPNAAVAAAANDKLSVAEGLCGLSLWQGCDSTGQSLDPQLFLLLSTSGTTGSAKFVRLSKANLQSNITDVIDALSISPDDRAIGNLPIHYVFGLSVLNTHLVAGASVLVTQEGPLSANFWNLVREHGATSFAGVPYNYQLLKRLNLECLDVPALNTLTQAGGRLDTQLIQHFQQLMSKRGGRFFVMYGQTEAAPRISTLPAHEVERKVGSVGRAMASGRIAIENGGNPVDVVGETGEVVYYGPNVMLGYADSRADLMRSNDMQGRLPTGDIGYLDADGYLFITGRIKRIAKIFGFRVNLDEIETMARASGAHDQVAAIEREKYIELFTTNVDADAKAALIAELAERTRQHPTAFRVTVVAELPVLPSGKVDYTLLKRLQ